MADSSNGSGIPILGPILDVLAGLFNQAANLASLAASVGEVERAVWTNAIQGATWAFGELGKIWDVLKSIGIGIALALYHVVIDYLLPILKKIIAAIKWIHDKVNKALQPIIKWIKRIRDWYLKHIFPWQHLALQIISGIRVFIELLRLLHVKWAAKLDAELQKIQGYITESITAVLGPLNSALSILGLAVDPSLFFRRDMFGRTLWNSLGDVKKAAGYGSSRPIFPDEKAQEKQMHDAVWGTQPLQTTAPDGSVVYDPALKVVDDSLTQQMQTQGIAP
jgi:hypothetical protein